MELFHHDANVDWMGKAKYFFVLSLLLLVIGLQSWIRKGSLDYGIDFKGGTAVYVRFAGTPPIDQLRAGLVQEGLGRSVIQRISDIGASAGNEVVIYLPQEGLRQRRRSIRARPKSIRPCTPLSEARKPASRISTLLRNRPSPTF